MDTDWIMRDFRQNIHNLEAAIIRDQETIAQIDDRVKMAGYQKQIDSLSAQIRSLADLIKRLSDRVSNRS